MSALGLSIAISNPARAGQPGPIDGWPRETSTPNPAELPPDGGGRLGLGAVLLGIGAPVGVVGFASMVGNDAVSTFAPMLAVGAAAVVGGAFLVHHGVVARRGYMRAAERRFGTRPPNRGTGLLVAGGITSAIAVGEMVGGAILLNAQPDDLGAHVGSTLLLVSGAGVTIAAAAMIGVGARNRGRYRQFLEDHRVRVSMGGPIGMGLALGGAF